MLLRVEGKHFHVALEKPYPKHRNVKRLQGDRFYNSGWQTCFNRDGQWITAMFKDKDYGNDPAKAFEAACKHADKTREQLGEPKTRWDGHQRQARVSKLHFQYNKACIGRKTDDRLKVTCMSCLQRIANRLTSSIDPDDPKNW